MYTHIDDKKPVIMQAQLTHDVYPKADTHTCFLTDERFTTQPGQVLTFLSIEFSYPHRDPHAAPYHMGGMLSPGLVAAGGAAIKAAIQQQIESHLEQMLMLAEEVRVFHQVLGSDLAFCIRDRTEK